MRKYALTLFFISFHLFLNAQDFITRWDLSIAGSGATQLSFGVGTVGICSYTWETIPAAQTGSGTFNGNTITITGLPANAMIRLKIDTTNYRRIYINNGIDRKRLQDVEQWGGVHWNTMNSAFLGCENLNITSLDLPNFVNVADLSNMFESCVLLNGPINIGAWNVSNVTSLAGMFLNASSFNQPIGNWNVSNVLDMGGLFLYTTSFNQPIGNWDVSNVQNMGAMFKGASAFNQPIGNWNTTNVFNMGNMFQKATFFNQPIGNWNIANVFNMTNMFQEATFFNQPIGNWNTNNITDMNNFFHDATSFNQPIDSWNTSNVTNMNSMFENATSFNQPINTWNTFNSNSTVRMFYGATSFNQPLSNWATLNLLDMTSMFYGALSFNQYLGSWSLHPGTHLTYMLDSSGMDCNNYSATLEGWVSNNPILPVNQQFRALNLKYLLYVQNKRNILINNKGWIINGDILDTNCCVAQYSAININACSSYYFNGQIITNNGIYKDTIASITGCDSIITINLTIQYPSSDTINISACNSYFFNGQIITSSGTYTTTLINATGCDSILTLNLTINTANTTVTQSGTHFTANATAATYQWLTCNPYQEIIGETNQSYTATVNGNYAVAVTQNGCTDTSACYTVIGIGINEHDISNTIKIFPNPVKNELQIESEITLQNAEIVVLNFIGQKIAAYQNISGKKIYIDLSAFAAGNYFVQIKDTGHSFVRKVYKER